MTRRPYPRCAKGGHEKPLNTHYVCDEHAGPGGFTNCAVCGTEIAHPRNYVCEQCVVDPFQGTTRPDVTR